MSAEKEHLEAAGFVVLRRKSHEHTLRELDRARNLLAFEKESSESTREWAVKAFDEQRRLQDRLTFVYGVARAFGASVEDLRQHDGPPPFPGRCGAELGVHPSRPHLLGICAKAPGHAGPHDNVLSKHEAVS